MLGVHLRVGGADDRAVREAQVVQGRLAQRDPDRLEVARGVARADLTRVQAVALDTPARERAVVAARDREGLGGIRDGRNRGTEVEDGVIDAIDRP